MPDPQASIENPREFDLMVVALSTLFILQDFR
jgi:hypothetical protein